MPPNAALTRAQKMRPALMLFTFMLAVVFATSSAQAAPHVYKPNGVMPPYQVYATSSHVPGKTFNRISIQHPRAVAVGFIYANGNGWWEFGTTFHQMGTHGVVHQAYARCYNDWAGGNVYGHCIWYD